MKRKSQQVRCPLSKAIAKRYHAARKFAQGANITRRKQGSAENNENSRRPSEDSTMSSTESNIVRKSKIEDFLSFLCFRSTPLLSPTLSIFNTPGNLNTQGSEQQIREIDGLGSINDSYGISILPDVVNRSKSLTASQRADQMDKKREFTLKLQALRRKYEEQRAKKLIAHSIDKSSGNQSDKKKVASSKNPPKSKEVKKPITKKPPVATKQVFVPKAPTALISNSGKDGIEVQLRMSLRSSKGQVVLPESSKRPVEDRKIPAIPIRKSTRRKIKIEK